MGRALKFWSFRRPGHKSVNKARNLPPPNGQQNLDEDQQNHLKHETKDCDSGQNEIGEKELFRLASQTLRETEANAEKQPSLIVRLRIKDIENRLAQPCRATKISRRVNLEHPSEGWEESFVKRLESIVQLRKLDKDLGLHRGQLSLQTKLESECTDEITTEEEKNGDGHLHDYARTHHNGFRCWVACCTEQLVGCDCGIGGQD